MSYKAQMNGGGESYSGLAQVRHGTVVFSDFEATEKRNFRVCSGGF
jgi:hypothetical protein